MFRNQFPALNKRIDSIFYKDPERAKMVISTLEAETELRKAAEQKRQEVDVVAKEAERYSKTKNQVFDLLKKPSPLESSWVIVISNIEEVTALSPNKFLILLYRNGILA